jgi:hypothetical protein
LRFDRVGFSARLPRHGQFGVEISIPDSHPTRVSTFKTKADAEAWIVDHRASAPGAVPNRDPDFLRLNKKLK